MSTTERVTELVEPLVAPLGLELVDVELAGPVLRLTVDRDGDLDVGLIATLSRSVSRTLEEQDPQAATYTLEVSSPGLERNLRRPDHFVRAVGSKVTIKAVAGTDGDRRVVGELLSADDDGIVVRPADAQGPDEDRRLGYDQIERARTVFDWGPAPKPGSKPANGAGRTPKPRSKKRKKAARS